MSPQTQPQTQTIRAKKDRTGLSHSKQLLENYETDESSVPMVSLPCLDVVLLYKLSHIDEEHDDFFETCNVS